jgi:hypothetical protein
LRADDGVDDVCGVAAVLGAVGGVDLVVKVVGLDQAHVLVDAAGLDVAFVAHLAATEPGGRAAVDGSDVEVVAVAYDPDGPGDAEGAVASTRGDLQFFCGRDPGEFVVGPCGHGDSLGRRVLWRPLRVG